MNWARPGNRDESNLTIFAYDLLVERTSDCDHFRATAKTEGCEFAARFPNANGGADTHPGGAKVQFRLNQRGAASSSRLLKPQPCCGLWASKFSSQLVSPSAAGATVAAPPFVKVGAIDGTHVHFTLDNDEYNCYSDAPILSSDLGVR